MIMKCIFDDEMYQRDNCMKSDIWSDVILLIVNNMFYPGTFLTDNCCNSNVEIVNNSSCHVSWYVPDLSS